MIRDIFDRFEGLDQSRFFEPGSNRRRLAYQAACKELSAARLGHPGCETHGSACSGARRPGDCDVSGSPSFDCASIWHSELYVFSISGILILSFAFFCVLL